jgi:CheY-like chemotaxis protein
MARVLIVEPDRRVRDFIAGILTDFGHQAEACSDRSEAYRLLRHAAFDVVASDLALGSEAAGAALLALSGRPLHRAGADRERPPPLRDMPFRLADLRDLVAAVGAAGEAARGLAA